MKTILDYGAIEGDLDLPLVIDRNRAAIEAACADGCAIIPKGVFLTHTVRLQHGAKIIGQGSASILKLASLAPRPVELFGLDFLGHRAFLLGAAAALNVRDVQIRDLALDGNAVAQVKADGTVTGACGISFLAADGALIENVEIIDTCYDGIYLGGRFDGDQYDGANPCRGMRIVRLVGTRNGRNAITITDGRDIVIADCRVSESAFGRYSALGNPGGWTGYPILPNGKTEFDSNAITIEPNHDYNESRQITIERCRVFRAHSRACGAAGLQGPSVQSRDIVIRAGHFETSDIAAGPAVHISATAQVRAAGLAVIDCTIRPGALNPSPLSVVGIERSVFAHNRFFAGAGANPQVAFDGCIKSAISANVIAGGILSVTNSSGIVVAGNVLDCTLNLQDPAANRYIDIN